MWKNDENSMMYVYSRDGELMSLSYAFFANFFM